MSAQVVVDGKQFASGEERFAFRGVTYGTFRPRDDGARFPDRERAKLDFAAMREAGFTVVRTYTPPPDDILALAADWDIRLLVDVFYPDWRYALGTSRRERRRVAQAAKTEVRNVARRLAGNSDVIGLSLGNEVPADAVRWFGTNAIAAVIEELAEVVREEDRNRLVTYANYPTTEYLPLECLDFLTFNVFLEGRVELRKYLTRLQHLAGDRPLVLGEIGIDAGEDRAGELRQAETVDWQLATALERGVAGTCLFSWTDEWWVGDSAVEGWHFGLTKADRSPRPALDVAKRWNTRTVADLSFDWPSISVVVCAYNAAKTLDECLRHTCALDYSRLEVLVVDDGSTDATAEIAARYPRVRLVGIAHAGLATARNEGLRQATGELVAYLDSDAYPSPEWPYYLALGMDNPAVGGVGGPNLPPPGDSPGAQRVARAPGGPLHVLLSDDRAEHVPGCNMAFWRQVLIETGGFDPVYTSAGDDVDVCWRVLDRGWEIAFHPAAVVWHHRRSGLAPYVKQQLGYGRSEALVEARHPNRFTPLGTARWRGAIYDSLAPGLARQRIYRGQYGSAAFQSVYQGGGHLLDVAHQAGIPLAATLLVSAPLGLIRPALALPAAVALAGILLIWVTDAARVQPSRAWPGRNFGFRAGVAMLHLAQPLARTWGRARYRGAARRGAQRQMRLPGPIRSLGRGSLLLPHNGPRAELADAAVAVLQASGFKVVPGTGWEDYDAQVTAGPFIAGQLLTSSCPRGWVQLRVRRRLRWRPAMSFMALVCLVALLGLFPAGVLLAIGLTELGRELRRTGVRRVFEAVAT
jgi:GT2 family glycosyltransferase